ncbi:hypothetical protein HZH66_005975 [Vespula vulgaris]|uniref:Uncharacterized protein n=1 Tax=Vespula vulgaris TaxID=7454 RepID=A0A834K639_VESVU|nr:hypothetical protein HZH66_005975 [Vespula vulgaris]
MGVKKKMREARDNRLGSTRDSANTACANAQCEVRLRDLLVRYTNLEATFYSIVSELARNARRETIARLSKSLTLRMFSICNKRKTSINFEERKQIFELRKNLRSSQKLRGPFPFDQSSGWRETFREFHFAVLRYRIVVVHAPYSSKIYMYVNALVHRRNKRD